jgi:hypothetical protein
MELFAAYVMVGLGYALATVPRAVWMCRLSVAILDNRALVPVLRSALVLLVALVAWPALLMANVSRAFGGGPWTGGDGDGMSPEAIREALREEMEQSDGREDEENDEEATEQREEGGVDGDGHVGRVVALPAPGADPRGPLGTLVRRLDGTRHRRPRPALRADVSGVRGASRSQPDVDAEPAASETTSSTTREGDRSGVL